MNQKGFVPIIIILGIFLILGIAGGTFWIRNLDFSSRKENKMGALLTDTKTINELRSQLPKPTTVPITNPSPTITSTLTPTLVAGKKNIHLYPFYGADPNISINKLNIIGVIFIPKNITTQIEQEWPTNMDKIFGKIKNFYQNQFENNIGITYQVISTPIRGDKNIEEYFPASLVEETINKNQNLIKKDSHNVWMVYLVRDKELKLNLEGGNLGGVAALNAATQYEFWLDNDAVNTYTYGITGSAHEFGHALGIPHPWELPINTSHDPNFGNVPGDIMGYSFSNDLDKNYIRDDIKKTMGL